jgi:hypothetical protein
VGAEDRAARPVAVQGVIKSLDGIDAPADMWVRPTGQG